MKFTKDNLYPGLYLIRASIPNDTPHLSFARTCIYKVVYQPTPEGNLYGLCSCFTDGWLDDLVTLDEFIEDLNNSAQTFKVVDKELALKVLADTQQGFDIDYHNKTTD